MRVALVSTAFRSREPLDLHAHARSLAAALARAGADVEVFTGAAGAGLAPYSQRRIEVLDHVEGRPFGVTTIELGADADPERIAAGFGAFLERERPTVCHMESLDRFGTDLVREARARGIGTIYCARDTWPAHDRTTLTLPDLSPFELGDAEAEARAILAHGLMGDDLPDEGPPESSAARDRLQALLHGDIVEREQVTALREAREAIEVRRAEKRAALSAVDRRFASSRLLARQLSATVGRAFTYRAPGVDTFLLPERGTLPKKRAPLRFGFVGTTRPTEGLQVLVDAFAQIRARADAPKLDLVVALERTDGARDDALQERAVRMGATVSFSPGAVDVRALLDAVDVLVFPGLWGAFAPAGLRIALTSGRVAIASNMPGVAEVAPQEAIRLVPPGDAGELEAAIVDLARRGPKLEAAHAAALGHRDEASSAQRADRAGTGSAEDSDADAAGVSRVEGPPRSEAGFKSIDDEAREWLDTYGLVAGSARARARTTRLPHVADVAAQLDELRELSVGELFARAQEGIGRLRRAFGVSEPDADLLARVIMRGGLSRDRVEQAAVAEAELESSLGELRAARAAMRAEESARVRRVADLQSILGQYEEEALARGAEAARVAEDLEASRGERDELSADLRTVRSERDELTDDLAAERERLETMSREKDELRRRFEDVAGEAESARTSLAETEAERDRLARSIEEREETVRGLRTRVAGRADGDESVAGALDAVEAHCVALERDVETLRRHDAWLGAQTDELAALFERIGTRTVAGGAGDGAASGAPTREQILGRTLRALERLTTELEWRRDEMAAARQASESLRARLAGGALTARVQSWVTGPPLVASEPPEAALDPPRGDSEGDEERAETESDAEASGDVEEPRAPLPARGRAEEEDRSESEDDSEDDDAVAAAPSSPARENQDGGDADDHEETDR
ncbi:MAG: glycosyltransferase [Planctomycetota bacterium]